jgi:hypothetical protein
MQPFFSSRLFCQTALDLNDERERSNRANGGRMRRSWKEESQRMMVHEKENEGAENVRSVVAIGDDEEDLFG